MDIVLIEYDFFMQVFKTKHFTLNQKSHAYYFTSKTI